jgi:hypothetical protein
VTPDPWWLDSAPLTSASLSKVDFLPRNGRRRQSLPYRGRGDNRVSWDLGRALWWLGFCFLSAISASVGWAQHASGPEVATAYPVAGLAPFERPAGAPTMTAFAPDEQWRAKALRGVSAPVPASLAFLQNQGRWYSPFLGPGMTGRYDIRGFHAADRR